MGVDVVLKMSAVRDPGWLLTALRHKFGHVITLGRHRPSALAPQGADLFEEGIAGQPVRRSQDVPVRAADAAPTQAHDEASRTAFGQPWQVGERACLAQIPQTIRT